jgi:ornithine--oxo-acid transaminase
MPARTLADALLARGIVAKDTHERVLRIAPPLVIDNEATALLLDRFADAILVPA